jgi:hypothetical protein
MPFRQREHELIRVKGLHPVDCAERRETVSGPSHPWIKKFCCNATKRLANAIRGRILCSMLHRNKNGAAAVVCCPVTDFCTSL